MVWCGGGVRCRWMVRPARTRQGKASRVFPRALGYGGHQQHCELQSASAVEGAGNRHWRTARREGSGNGSHLR